MNSALYLILLFFSLSCSPTKILIKHDMITSYYFENKIAKADKKENKTEIDKKTLLRLNVEYGFGVLMEKSDKIILEDYSEGLKNYKKQMSILVMLKVLVLIYYLKNILLLNNGY